MSPALTADQMLEAIEAFTRGKIDLHSLAAARKENARLRKALAAARRRTRRGVCAWCGTPFIRKANARWCQPSCREAQHRAAGLLMRTVSKGGAR